KADQQAAILEMHGAGKPITQIARITGLSRPSVYRVLKQDAFTSGKVTSSLTIHLTPGLTPVDTREHGFLGASGVTENTKTP
ncbi:MAG: helix-turn-helix domain-containing protein, partial [Gemmataceae bacterium]